jgi:hypothetical protein
MEDEKCPICGYDPRISVEDWQRQVWENEEETCGQCHKPVKHKDGTYRHGFWYHSGECASHNRY